MAGKTSSRPLSSGRETIITAAGSRHGMEKVASIMTSNIDESVSSRGTERGITITRGASFHSGKPVKPTTTGNNSRDGACKASYNTFSEKPTQIKEK